MLSPRPLVLALLVTACQSPVDPLAAHPDAFVMGAITDLAGEPGALLDPKDPEVEVFPAGKAAEAELFAEALRQIAAAEGVEAEVQTVRTQGGAIHVEALALKETLIPRFPGALVEVAAGPPGVDLPPRQVVRLAAGHPSFEDEDWVCAYLAGVYLHHDAGGRMRFPNSRGKAEVVAELLVRLGCRAEVRAVQQKYPAIFQVDCTLSPQVRSLFDRVEEGVSDRKSR